MALLKRIFGLFSGGGAVTEKAVDMADKAFYTAQERGAQDAADTAEARTMTAPSHGTWFDVLVDGVSRMIRPGITIWLMGGFAGWWAMPRIETAGEYWQNIFMIVLTFWFGGRAILKDLPGAIKAMRGK